MRFQIIRNGVRSLSSSSSSRFSGRRQIFDCLKPYFPNWKKRYEQILREGPPTHEVAAGLDLHHWLVRLKPLRGRPPTDEVISYYVDTLSLLVPRDEAVNKIYSVATKRAYAFGANILPEQADSLEGLYNVIEIFPDHYLLNPTQKTHPLDPFINGKALPYDPKNYPILLTDCLTDEELEASGELRPRPPDAYAKPSIRLSPLGRLKMSLVERLWWV